MANNISSKSEALQALSNLPEKTLIRIAELSQNKKAQGYFSNPIQFAVLKGFLK